MCATGGAGGGGAAGAGGAAGTFGGGDDAGRAACGTAGGGWTGRGCCVGWGASGPYRCGAGRTLARPVCTVGFTGCSRGPAGRAGSVAGFPLGAADGPDAGGPDAGGPDAGGFGAGDSDPAGDPGSDAGPGPDACSGPPWVSPTAPSSCPVAILGQTTYVGRRAAN